MFDAGNKQEKCAPDPYPCRTASTIERFFLGYCHRLTVTISPGPPATVLERSGERQPSGWYEWYEQNGCLVGR